jgi:uncharacterized protein (TIGR02646 family)
MKFLTKNPNSEILAKGITYKKDQSKNNEWLRDLLLLEQKRFCAYSEIYIRDSISVEVEHFDPSKKYNDNYYNYYSVLHSCNSHNKKMYEFYKGSGFFNSLFFQDNTEFNKRIKYKDGFYQEIDPEDSEAIELIEFLGFNRLQIAQDRDAHIEFLKKVFADANYSKEQQLEHFRKFNHHLDFITAIEVELELDLSEFYN